MTPQPRKRVGVLISGRGSNMAALIAATMDPAYPAEIVAVVSNVASAKGLETAERHGIATIVIAHRDYESRAAHDDAVHAALKGVGAEYVALAGYMRLLSPHFVRKWQGRMINIHPALLPSFKGLDTHARALAAGVRIHGCTVHFVTEGMDEGPVIAQGAVRVLPEDTEETLSARVLKVEHRLYPMALRLVCEGQARMSDGRAVIDHKGADDAEYLLSPPEGG